MEKSPVAFLSYAHVDDKYGRVSELRERLSSEVEMATGADFAIFQDRKDIHWGLIWRERIEESLDGVTFLIPILTPSFFKSEACRRELERFFRREEDLRRHDLILPIYYLQADIIDDQDRRRGDELATKLSERQYVSWRHLRHKSFDDEEVRAELENLAFQIKTALLRSAKVTGPSSAPAAASAEAGAAKTPPVGREELRGILRELVEELVSPQAPANIIRRASPHESSEQDIYEVIAKQHGVSVEKLRAEFPKFARSLTADRDKPLLERAQAALAADDYLAAEKLAVEAANHARDCKPLAVTDVVDGYLLAAEAALKQKKFEHVDQYLQCADDLIGPKNSILRARLFKIRGNRYMDANELRDAAGAYWQASFFYDALSEEATDQIEKDRLKGEAGTMAYAGNSASYYDDLEELSKQRRDTGQS